jgi:photosystem II stability/assembly factor-like uncharacterized protein
MNKNLLSIFVLVGFAFFAVFPASTKSITDHVIVAAKAKTPATALAKAAVANPKRAKS